MGPSPGNTNPQGRCGASMGAWATIRKPRGELFRAGFGSDCALMDDPSGLITTKVVWRVGVPEPEVHEVPAEEFFS